MMVSFRYKEKFKDHYNSTPDTDYFCVGTFSEISSVVTYGVLGINLFA
jgi:hypothetical protein